MSRVLVNEQDAGALLDDDVGVQNLTDDAVIPGRQLQLLLVG